jgi:hypothetical protein
LRAEPRHAGAWNNLGHALRGLDRPAEAEESYRQAVALRPDLAGVHNNLGSALLALHQPAQALESFAEAVQLQPDYAEACNNMGGALIALDRPDEAVLWFRRALALDPDLAQARLGEAIALLTLGAFDAGWEAYEARWGDPRFQDDEPSRSQPLWRGGPLDGKRILLHAEQGLGDTIQFVRYAPLVRRLGAHVVVEVQPPLMPLLGGLADELVPQQRPAQAPSPAAAACDLRCPLMSLPFVFRTTLETVPAEIPYVAAPAERQIAWTRALGHSKRLRVGVAFSGRADHPDDAIRSIPAARMLPPLLASGAELHVVQSELRPSDAAMLAGCGEVRIHASQLSDFADTAALVSLMDLVISVDTSVAHLAGALGRPVWILLQLAADFRWLRQREDSPWYPTARLFRQERDGEWETVLARVAGALRQLLRRAGVPSA